MSSWVLPQDLYYRPQTPFVAGFVGANNRIVGRATAKNAATIEVTTQDGWVIHARGHGSIALGDLVEGFVRPEVATLGRQAGELPAAQPVHSGQVQSVLFDGANSAVLLQEARTRREFRIALPQTGQFSDLKTLEAVSFSFDPRAGGLLSGASGGDGSGWLTIARQSGRHD